MDLVLVSSASLCLFPGGIEMVNVCCTCTGVGLEETEGVGLLEGGPPWWAVT